MEERVNELLGEVRRLESVLEDRDREIRDLKTDLASRDSIIKVRDVEVKELSMVIARNLTRVQAETAVASQQIAQATQPQRREDAY